MSKNTLDRTDKRILALLQNDGLMSNVELADRVGLSPTPCARRVKVLHDDGWITHTVALLDAERLGLNLTAMVQVTIEKHTPQAFQAFEEAISVFEEVMECYLMTGQKADYQLKVVVRDMSHFQHFILEKLTPTAGVRGVQSSFVMRRVLDKTALPVG